MNAVREGCAEFARQLGELGLAVAPDPAKPDHLSFPYLIPIGRFAGQPIRIGVVVPPDFPRTPPSGPHISPPLIGQYGGGPGGVHASGFGAEWEYWSRPYQNWGRDGRDVGAYLAFLRTLFATT